MSAHVGILCSEEMFNWRDCLIKNVSENLDKKIKFSTCTEDDYADKKKQSIFRREWSDAPVLVYMISPTLLNHLENSSNIKFPSLKAKVYLFFCGVEQNCSKNLDFRNLFDNFDLSFKYSHEEFHSLVESVIEILLQSGLDNPAFATSQLTLHQSSKKFEKKDFVLIPKNILIEKQPAVMIMIFDESTDVNDFNISVDGVCDKKSIRPDQIAPNILKFSLPRGISPGLGRVNIHTKGRRIGSQTFVSHSATLQNHLIGVLDLIINKVKQSRQLSLGELDEMISKCASNEATCRPEETSADRFEQGLQGLLSLVTRHNLKGSCVAISKLNRSKIQRKTVGGENLSRSPSNNSPKSTADHSAIPEHQRELIEILNGVKSGQCTVEDAEKLFKYWNLRHENNIKDDKQLSKRKTLLDTRKISRPFLPKLEERTAQNDSNDGKISSKIYFENFPKRNDQREIRVRLSTPNDYSGLDPANFPTDNYIIQEIYCTSANDVPTYNNDSCLNSSTEDPDDPDSRLGMYLSMSKVSRENSPSTTTMNGPSKTRSTQPSAITVATSDSLEDYVNVTPKSHNTLRISSTKLPPPPPPPLCRHKNN